MIHEELRRFLETLTRDAGPIVVDCGHVDTKELVPRPADGATLHEGLECFNTIKKADIAPVKLSVLFNETHLLNTAASKAEGRKQIKGLKKEIKSQGIPQSLLNIYKTIFDEYGILQDKDFFKSEFICLSENNLILRSWQDIEKYRNGSNPFKKNLMASGKGFKFRLQNSAEVELAYAESGAPGWPLVSASIVNFFEKQGFKTIICLRDAYWAPRVKTGGMVAQELYGCNNNTHAFFYTSDNGVIIAS